MFKMRAGLLYFHQGWTDIVNCLPLINYYSDKFEDLFLIVREDAQPIVSFYVSTIPNLTCFLQKKELIERDFGSTVVNVLNMIGHADVKLLFHGQWDMYRNDIYRGRFQLHDHHVHFATKFYESYGISIKERVNSFSISRDLEREEIEYQEFISKHGDDYVIVHDSSEKRIPVDGVRVGDSFDNPYFAIKILQNAKEIHLLDSVWAAVCFQLDSKYSILRDKRIVVYPFNNRGGSFYDSNVHDRETRVIDLKNWEVEWEKEPQY